MCRLYLSEYLHQMTVAGAEFIWIGRKKGANFKKMNCLSFRKARERQSKKRSLTYCKLNFNGLQLDSINQLVRTLPNRTDY